QEELLPVTSIESRYVETMALAEWRRLRLICLEKEQLAIETRRQQNRTKEKLAGHIKRKMEGAQRAKAPFCVKTPMNSRVNAPFCAKTEKVKTRNEVNLTSDNYGVLSTLRFWQPASESLIG